ncbi:hypothetical protein [Pseudomonas sp. RIT-PI-AD]|uniref:hypothetical protein n=1 Tax=Pseudomonas sp. RIT-PI-AD TaxID=3035294 RepID=UPI0021D86EA0|nr:hypothetical protein [Pseudomonas sp. RIT-PI-AD]
MTIEKAELEKYVEESLQAGGALSKAILRYLTDHSGNFKFELLDEPYNNSLRESLGNSVSYEYICDYILECLKKGFVVIIDDVMASERDVPLELKEYTVSFGGEIYYLFEKITDRFFLKKALEVSATPWHQVCAVFEYSKKSDNYLADFLKKLSGLDLSFQKAALIAFDGEGYCYINKL